MNTLASKLLNKYAKASRKAKTETEKIDDISNKIKSQDMQFIAR